MKDSAKQNMRRLVSVALLSLALPSPSVADETAVARQIHRRIAELETLRASVSSAATERERQRENMKGRIERLELDAAAMGAELVELRDEIAAVENQRQKYEQEINRIAAAAEMLQKTAVPTATRMHDRIATGIGADRSDRLLAVEAAREKLADENPRTQFEGTADLAIVALRELQMAQERELRNEPVTTDGRRKHAYVYRLGLVTEGFVSEDGRASGIANAADESWHAPPDIKDPVAAIIAVMRQRQTPQWLNVPIMAEIEVGSGQKGEP